MYYVICVNWINKYSKCFVRYLSPPLFLRINTMDFYMFCLSLILPKCCFFFCCLLEISIEFFYVLYFLFFSCNAYIFIFQIGFIRHFWKLELQHKKHSLCLLILLFAVLWITLTNSLHLLTNIENYLTSVNMKILEVSTWTKKVSAIYVY